MSRTRGVARRIVQAAAWAIILAVAAVLAAAVVVPRIAGATPYAVLTGSMQPDLPPGTLVVVRPGEQVSLGDVITYQLDSGEPTVVTHRVVGQGVSADGDTTFTTQGDANDTPDPEPVRPVQVRGELWYSVPHLGRANDILDGRERQMMVYVVASGLFLYAGTMVGGAVRDRRRKPADADAEARAEAGSRA